MGLASRKANIELAIREGRLKHFQWMPVSKITWTFEDAHQYVTNLGLSGPSASAAWMDFCKSGKKPVGIPVVPRLYYPDDWEGIIHWLGWDKRRRNTEWVTLDECMEYARSLSLTGTSAAKAWHSYWKENERPVKIPSSPQGIYKENWPGWREFVGWGPEYRPFAQAREYVRSLNLSGKCMIRTWRSYCKSGRKPCDIPSCPERIYKEYEGMKDWLGWERFMSFEDARNYVISLNFNGKNVDAEWRIYLASGKKPKNLPAAPWAVYKEEWANMNHFMGRQEFIHVKDGFMSFDQAREYVVELGLGKGKRSASDEWKDYSKSGRRPRDLPSAPHMAYREQWKGIAHFCGVGKRKKTPKEWVPVVEKLAKENGGKIPSSSVLCSRGLYGLAFVVRERPELFIHLRQDDKSNLRDAKCV